MFDLCFASESVCIVLLHRFKTYNLNRYWQSFYVYFLGCKQGSDFYRKHISYKLYCLDPGIIWFHATVGGWYRNYFSQFTLENSYDSQTSRIHRNDSGAIQPVDFDLCFIWEVMKSFTVLMYGLCIRRNLQLCCNASYTWEVSVLIVICHDKAKLSQALCIQKRSWFSTILQRWAM